MSQIRDSTQHAFKFWKFFSFPEKFGGELLTFLMKKILFIAPLASIILFFFFSLWLRCPSCDINTVQNLGTLHQLQPHPHHLETTKTNISHILFGIGGSVGSWNTRRHYSELWWKQNVTRGFVWLDESPQENETWLETSPPYRVSEDTSRFKFTNSYGSRSAIRIARIVLESFKLGFDDVRWFVLGDDDTVFFVENLVDVLSRYDHKEMYYIGGNSESVEQDVIHSYGMAYGGGGIAISYPLMVQLVKLLDGCIDRYSELYGSDERIGACVNEIGVPVTREVGFHQVDIRGDPFGLLAAHPVAPLVSLHHLDAVEPLFPTGNQTESLRTLMGAYKKDPARTLQQSFCYDLHHNWSVSVSWGYLVQIYPTFLTAKELQTPFRTFNTWRTWSEGPFAFNTRPISGEVCERPVVFYLDSVNEVGHGGTRTSYKRFLSEGEEECDLATYAPILALQTVNVSSSRLQHSELNTVRRRQCCDIVNNMDGVLQIRIRKCRRGETVTPP